VAEKKRRKSTSGKEKGIEWARRKLEKMLIFDVRDEALSAGSGTDTHGFENIKGVGVSERIIAGWLTDVPCVTVYVAAKVPLDEVSEAARVPKTLNGVPTDVVEIGEIDAFPFKGRYRPAPGGVSVGHFKITAGTIGCLVKKSGKTYLLSNNHVLANVNQAVMGDPILQPGPFDGGTVGSDMIAKLSAFIPISFTSPNDVDCAIAQVNEEGLVTLLNKVLGKLSLPVVPAAMNMIVSKCGRTTQFTRGRITGLNTTVRVGYGASGTAILRNQIIIQSMNTNPFSQGGDSGSLIVNQNKQPVALLFAGSTSHTIANPIQTVLSALGVSVFV
jgi:Peptidase family S64